MKKLTIVALLGAVAGCASIQLQQASEKRSQALSLCNEQRKANIFKMASQYANCYGDAEEEFARSGYPYPDLIYNLVSYQKSIAAKIDSKKISKQDGVSLIAEKTTELTNEEMRRNQAAQQQRQTAVSQYLMMQQLQQPQPSHMINCTSTGGYGVVNTTCR